MNTSVARLAEVSGEQDDDIRRIDTALSELMRLTQSQRIHDSRARATGVHLSRTLSRLLATVDDLGPVSVSRLAAVMDVSQPTASRSLLQLEEEGYVARAGDPADGRVVMYAVTATGRRARQRLRDHMREQMAAALDGMSDTRRAELADLLSDFVERLYSAGDGSVTTPPRRVATRGR
jgi:DNA-binding MarR family transcriptional regulator